MVILDLEPFSSQVKGKLLQPENFRVEKTDGIDILLTSRNGDRKIMESIRIMSTPSSRIRMWEAVEPVQMNIYQSNTYRKDLRWLHFDDEPRVQEVASERPAVLHIRFCS